MTKKDYILITNAIAAGMTTLDSTLNTKEVIDAFARLLRKDNERFDERRFRNRLQDLWEEKVLNIKNPRYN